MSEFVAFDKIYRYSRNCVVTEKIDGTNAQIYIDKDHPGVVLAGSRKRWLKIGDDNFGFAGWVAEHESELALGLGPGRHFGEWWGSGIQRGYGIKEKRFSLFNVGRWNESNPPPSCCCVVPVLYRGAFSDTAVSAAMETLRANGSYAAKGYADPEGIVIYHTQSGYLFKKTFKHDESGKGT